MLERYFIVYKSTGFAHIACRLIADSTLFKSKITMHFNEITILLNGPHAIEKMMGIMALDIKPGYAFLIKAEGKDEQEAIWTITDSLDNMEKDKSKVET